MPPTYETIPWGIESSPTLVRLTPFRLEALCYTNTVAWLAVGARNSPQEAFRQIARHSEEQCSRGFQPVSGFGIGGMILCDRNDHRLYSEPGIPVRVAARLPIESMKPAVVSDPENAIMILVQGIYEIHVQPVGLRWFKLERFKLEAFGRSGLAPSSAAPSRCCPPDPRRGQ